MREVDTLEKKKGKVATLFLGVMKKIKIKRKLRTGQTRLPKGREKIQPQFNQIERGIAA